jgi:hypothetical protein
MTHEDDHPSDVWERACRKAETSIHLAPFEERGDACIEAAAKLLSVAFELKGYHENLPLIKRRCRDMIWELTSKLEEAPGKLPLSRTTDHVPK